MNKSILLILLGITALPALADAGNSEMGANKDECRQQLNCQKRNPKQHMTRMLSLRDDQVDAVMKVLKEAHEQRKALRQSGREQHKALHEKTLQQLKPLLDEKQMARFVSFSESMKKKHQQRMQREGKRSGE